jgi:ammonia channel protein AmtB
MVADFRDIAGWGAISIGILSGSFAWASTNIMGKKWKAFMQVDDVLGVVHTHLVAGFVGGMSVAPPLASPTVVAQSTATTNKFS